MLRGRGIPPPAEALGRGRPLRGGARERVGVEVAEPGLDVAFTGCLKASGEGVAGVRSLLGEGTLRAVGLWRCCLGFGEEREGVEYLGS